MEFTRLIVKNFYIKELNLKYYVGINQIKINNMNGFTTHQEEREELRAQRKKLIPLIKAQREKEKNGKWIKIDNRTYKLVTNE